LVEALSGRSEVFSDAELRLRHDLGEPRLRAVAGLMSGLKVDPATLALELWRIRK
jgi:hypothetical protein